ARARLHPPSRRGRAPGGRVTGARRPRGGTHEPTRRAAAPAPAAPAPTARTGDTAPLDADPRAGLYDLGLQADVATLIDRRRVLQLLGLAGVFAVAACAPGASASPSSVASSAAASASTAYP